MKKLGAKLKDRVKAKLAERVLDAGIGALVIGAVASLFDVNLAPTEVDVLVTAAATLAAVLGRWRAARKN